MSRRGWVNAEIICIGTELLLGHIVNTNASFIASRLAGAGIDHYYQTTVGDNHKRLEAAIKKGLQRSDIVITTGGLGPTVDDITTEVIARSAARKLSRGKPEGAKPLKNPFGTALGFILKVAPEKTIIALPGPPREMQPMVENYVIPYLKKTAKVAKIIKSRSIKLIGLPEASVNNKARDLLRLAGAVTVGIYARLGEVELKIMAKADGESRADIKIKKIETIIRKRLKPYIYGVDDETLEGAAAKLLLKRKKTLACAESCTGGLLSNLLTDIPGSSGFFLEGIICYSDESKVNELNVNKETIRKKGAVSAEAAKEMAVGIRLRAGSHIGVGITGIAGPSGATKTKPVGLVFIALALKNRVIVRQFNFSGLRKEVKSQAARAALNMLRCELL
ncbi:MAG: nicotinamide-nucleotide amidohydrolase family protein [Candidatus Omnitrophica bacterium]|nr:nicotinamide-nucleotide amidohydrolase family protein [Candidatus Omnitrophota bacterium]